MKRPRWVRSSDGTLIDSMGRAFRVEETIDRPTQIKQLPDPPPVAPRSQRPRSRRRKTSSRPE